MCGDNFAVKFNKDKPSICNKEHTFFNACLKMKCFCISANCKSLIHWGSYKLQWYYNLTLEGWAYLNCKNLVL